MTSGGSRPVAVRSRGRRLLSALLAVAAIAGGSDGSSGGENGEPSSMTMDQTTSISMLTAPTAMGMSTGLMVDSSAIMAKDSNVTTMNNNNNSMGLTQSLYLEYAEVNYTLLLPILPNATQIHLGLVVDQR